MAQSASVQAVIEALSVFAVHTDKNSIDAASKWLQDFQHTVRTKPYKTCHKYDIPIVCTRMTRGRHATSSYSCPISLMGPGHLQPKRFEPRQVNNYCTIELIFYQLHRSHTISTKSTLPIAKGYATRSSQRYSNMHRVLGLSSFKSASHCPALCCSTQNGTIRYPISSRRLGSSLVPYPLCSNS